MLSLITHQYELLWFTRLRHARRPDMHLMVTLPKNGRHMTERTLQHHA
jgi:hypothetical protein